VFCKRAFWNGNFYLEMLIQSGVNGQCCIKKHIYSSILEVFSSRSVAQCYDILLNNYSDIKMMITVYHNG
jgi:hypothetical protein